DGNMLTMTHYNGINNGAYEVFSYGVKDGQLSLTKLYDGKHEWRSDVANLFRSVGVLMTEIVDGVEWVVGNVATIVVNGIEMSAKLVGMVVVNGVRVAIWLATETWDNVVEPVAMGVGKLITDIIDAGTMILQPVNSDRGFDKGGVSDR